MARNKYPEQTVERILEVSTKLFMEKGYENTSLQDILTELGDLTKGAIYHHFKSKEDIFDAVASRLGKKNAEIFIDIRKRKDLTGKEKLQLVLKYNISSSASKSVIDICPNLLEMPKFLAMQLKTSFYDVVPNYVLPIIEEGCLDGSIKCDKPRELAEIITMLLNIWLNPVMLGVDKHRMANKCKMINRMLSSYDLVLFDEEIIKTLEEL